MKIEYENQLSDYLKENKSLKSKINRLKEINLNLKDHYFQFQNQTSEQKKQLTFQTQLIKKLKKQNLITKKNLKFYKTNEFEKTTKDIVEELNLINLVSCLISDFKLRIEIK